MENSPYSLSNLIQIYQAADVPVHAIIGRATRSKCYHMMVQPPFPKEHAMSKSQDAKKTTKKEPAKTLKEKKEAKKVKKEEKKRQQ